MRSPNWYAGWRHDAVHELTENNTRLADQFRLGSWSRYDYDLDLGTLVFSESGVAKVVAEIQIVGSTSAKAGNWLWAWANSHWPSAYVADSKLVREYGEEHGICELTQDYIKGENLNELGWALTSVTAKVCGCVGAYRPKLDNGDGLYLVFRSVKLAE